MWNAVLESGTQGWYIYLVVAGLVLSGTYAYDKRATTSWLASLFVILYILFGDMKYVLAEPGASAITVLKYLGMGVIWSTVRWIMFSGKQKDLYQEQVASSIAEGSTPELAKEAAKKQYPKPDVRKHFGDLFYWWLFWPVSAVVYVAGDFIVSLLRKLGEAFRGVWQFLSDLVWKGVDY